MRIGHCSDLHLGFRAGLRQTAAGRNLREQDVSDAFRYMIPQMLSADLDAVFVAGDVFHRPNPGNLAIRDAAWGVAQLLSAGLPVFIVEGNHDGPNVEEGGTGTPLMALAPFGARVIRRAERLTIPSLDCEILCVPDRDIRNVPLVPGTGASTQLLLAHGSIGGRLAKLPGVDVLPAEAISDAFDYCAIGDYHSLERIARNAWYCGATEFTSSDPWREIGTAKGWLLVDTVAGTVEHQPVPTRRHIDLAPISAHDLGAADVTKLILEQIAAADVAGAVVRQKVTECDRGLRRALDHIAIRKATADACIFNLDPRPPEEYAAGSMISVLRGPEPPDWTDAFNQDEPVEQFDAVTDEQVDAWLADPSALERLAAENRDPYQLDSRPSARAAA